MKEKLNELVDAFDEMEFSTLEFILLIAVAFLSGTLLGMIFSPKRQIQIGSNNGNDSGNNWAEYDFDDDDDDEEDDEIGMAD